MKEKFSLPEKWEVKRLDEVCTLINGRAYKKTELLDKGKYPVLRVGNFFTNNHWYYSDLELSDDKYCDIGDLLYAWSASFGPRIWSGKKVIYHYHIWKVVPNEKLISKEFLYLILDWDTEKIKKDQGTGTTMMHVGKGSMDAREIPLPPLPEQQRIVAILDECFEAIDKAKVNAQQNLKNSKELFESYLQGVFENKGEGWEEKTLGDVCNVIAGQSPEGKYYNKDGNGMPFYQGKKEYGEKFIGKPTTWTTVITKEAEANDILMSVRAPVGPINFATQKICIGRGLAAIRAGKLVEIEYVFNFLLKHENEIVGNCGAVFNSINKAQIEAIEIPLPPLEEQKTIVKKLDTLSAETKKLEAFYQQKIKDLEELKKSVLQKAFVGELKMKLLENL